MPTSPPAVRRSSRFSGMAPADRQLARRTLLLDAAYDLLGNDGDAATTVRAVCAKAQLNPRYFYENFADRDALLVAVFDRTVATMSEAVLAAVSQAGEDPDAVSRAGISTVVHHVTDDPRRARVLYSEALGNEAVNRRRIETNYAVIEFLVGWTRRRGDSPVGDDPIADVAASMLVGGMSELLMAWLDNRIEITIDRLIEDAVLLFRAVGEAATAIAERHPNPNPNPTS